MELGLLLHFYQPSSQLESVFRDVVEQSYYPLLKMFQSLKNVKPTFNIPLSLLEQMDAYGYSDWISSIKDLHDSGRIELVGSGAYHPLMSKLGTQFNENQIILNEYGLAYYLGQHKGFEGEPCVMIRDLRGFFPPEMAVSDHVVEVIEGMGYDWVVLDEYAIKEEHLKKGVVFQIKGSKIKVVARDRNLSNLFAFTRGFEHSHIISEIVKSDRVRVIALDAETFGHHNKEGVYMLEAVLIGLYKKGFRVSFIEDIVSSEKSFEVDGVQESTWSTNVMLYPMWNLPDNQIQNLLWELYQYIHKEYFQIPASSSFDKNLSIGSGLEGFEHMPIWKAESLKDVPDSIKKSLNLSIALAKSEQSDQFWWASGVEIMGQKKFSRYMIDRALSYYEEVARLMESPDVLDTVETYNNKIRLLLDSGSS